MLFRSIFPHTKQVRFADLCTALALIMLEGCEGSFNSTQIINRKFKMSYYDSHLCDILNFLFKSGLLFVYHSSLSGVILTGISLYFTGMFPACYLYNNSDACV